MIINYENLDSIEKVFPKIKKMFSDIQEKTVYKKYPEEYLNFRKKIKGMQQDNNYVCIYFNDTILDCFVLKYIKYQEVRVDMNGKLFITVPIE